MALTITYQGKTGDTRFKIPSKYVSVTQVKVGGSNVSSTVAANECVITALVADAQVDIILQTEDDYSFASIVSGTVGVFKASAGTLFRLNAQNRTDAKRYLQLYNKATNPVIGTDTPVATYDLREREVVLKDDIRQAFATGIAWGITTDRAGTTAATSGDVQGTARYF
jgi:hypothetical protein